MSEQKYDVKLKQEAYIDNTDMLGHANYYEDHIWLDVDFYFVTKRERDSFTKTKLSKIMDGALYKEMKDVVEYRTDTLIESNTGWSFTDEIIGDIEWINPLIELVPVEEEE